MVTTLPDLGLGTSNLGIKFGDDHDGPDDPDECVDAVAAALDLGYRHIDTAQMYQNEHLVGEAIQRSGVDREEVFLATKVHPSNLAFDDVIESTRESLSKLRTDYVDLLYVHWPITAYDPEDTLPAFDRLYDEGTIEHVGVSNFTVETLERAREILDAPIAANQIQIHPLLPPTEGERADVLPYADEHDIDIVAWSPLARGDALSLGPVQAVAEKHGASPARVILAWLYEYDLKLIVKASTQEHLRDNVAARSLELDAEDIDTISVVIGPSGSGKSTLLRCVNRLEKIQSGEVRLDGESVSAPDADTDRLRQRVGMVFQQFSRRAPGLKERGVPTLSRKRDASRPERKPTRAFATTLLHHIVPPGSAVRPQVARSTGRSSPALNGGFVDPEGRPVGGAHKTPRRANRGREPHQSPITRTL